METHTVPEGVSKIRITDYAIGIFSLMPSRKGIKKAVSRKEVLVDGKLVDSSHWVESGQVIDLLKSKVIKPKPYRISVPVVYEDEHIALVNKPGGVSVSGNQHRTMVQALPSYLSVSKEADRLPLFYPVHRLDAPTCGLLLVAKTRRAQIFLGKQFADQSVHKEYTAVVHGLIEEEGEISTKISERSALSTWERLKVFSSARFGKLCLIRLSPKTGRTHQLRIHTSSLGHPILGDKMYGQEGKILHAKGLFLCATRLCFEHPLSKETMEFSIDTPPKFSYYLEREQMRFQRMQSE